MDSHTLRLTIAGTAVLLSTLLVAWLHDPTPSPQVASPPSQQVASLPEPASDPLVSDGPLVLSGDVTAEVRELATVVVDAARHHGVPVVADELEIRFVDRIDPGSFVAGRTDGDRIVVGRNVAEPERTLLHELAHAVVGIEHGHREPWRSVYVTAVGEVFGERRAEREMRRIRWVYDKSYLESSDPERDR